MPSLLHSFTHSFVHLFKKLLLLRLGICWILEKQARTKLGVHWVCLSVEPISTHDLKSRGGFLSDPSRNMHEVTQSFAAACKASDNRKSAIALILRLRVNFNE